MAVHKSQIQGFREKYSIYSIHAFLAKYESLPKNTLMIRHVIPYFLEEAIKEIEYHNTSRQEGIAVYAKKDGCETDVFPSIHQLAQHIKATPANTSRGAKKGWKVNGWTIHYI